MIEKNTLELESGMVIAQDIFDDNGILIIADGTVLKESHIEFIQNDPTLFFVKIQSFQDLDIQAEPEPPHVSDPKFQELKKEYTEAVTEFRGIFESVKLGGKLLHSELDNFTTRLVDEVERNGPMIAQRLWQLRTTDPYTFEHSVQVSLYATLLGKWLDMDEKELKELAVAGLMHDIGKCNIPDSILNKPSRLTDDEMKVMRTHARLGYVLLATAKEYETSILSGVLQHHERCDGSGYPNGLKRHYIHPYARIVAIADVFSAMTSKRVYKEAACPFTVVDQLISSSYGSMDPYYVKEFTSNLCFYFVGLNAVLSDGRVGEIIFIDKSSPTRPLIRTENEFVNLNRVSGITVEKLI